MRVAGTDERTWQLVGICMKVVGGEGPCFDDAQSPTSLKCGDGDSLGIRPERNGIQGNAVVETVLTLDGSDGGRYRNFE